MGVSTLCSWTVTVWVCVGVCVEGVCVWGVCLRVGWGVCGGGMCVCVRVGCACVWRGVGRQRMMGDCT